MKNVERPNVLNAGGSPALAAAGRGFLDEHGAVVRAFPR